MKKLIIIFFFSIPVLGKAQAGIQLMNEGLKSLNMKKKLVENTEKQNDSDSKNISENTENQNEGKSKISKIPQNLKIKQNKTKLDSINKKIVVDSMSVEFWPFVREYVSDYSDWLTRKINATEKTYFKTKIFLTKNNELSNFEEKIKKFETIFKEISEIQKYYNENFKITKITLVDYLKEESVVLTSQQILKEQEKIEGKVDTLFNEIRTIQKTLTEAENKLIKKVKDQEAVDLTSKVEEKRLAGVAPAFSSFFGNGLKIVPQISILGSSILSSESKDFVAGGEIKFFTSGNSAQSKIQFIDLLYSDLSSYCIQMNLQSVFAPAVQQKERKTIGIGLTTNFLGKTLNFYKTNAQNTSDTASAFSNMFHTKLGIEGSLFKNFLTPYVNYNDMRLITNKSKIEALNQNFMTFNGTGFLDFGTKFLLNIEQLASVKNINMMLDLNFLKIDKLEKFTGIKDKLYPSIRFSFDKRL